MAPDYDNKVSDYDEKVPESEKKVPECEKKYMKKAGVHIGLNVVQITIKMRTIIQIILKCPPFISPDDRFCDLIICYLFSH